MKHNSPSAATDVAVFIEDLDGNQFDLKLSTFLSMAAASAMDQEKVATVEIKFDFARIGQSHQVICKHKLKISRPTLNGRATEDEERETVFHVGQYGALTLTQPTLSNFGSQESLIEPAVRAAAER
jgi:hypothetical protein